MTSIRLTAALCAGIATIAVTPIAAAQTAPAHRHHPAARGDQDDTTEDIIVTANRRVENTLNVPVAVSVIRPESLRDYQAAGARHAAVAVGPGARACTSNARPAASSRASTSAGSAISISTSARRSRCRSSRTTSSRSTSS